MENQTAKKRRGSIWAWLIPLVTLVLFIALVFVALHRLYYQANDVVSTVVSGHIQTLSGIFKRIDHACDIVDFEHEKNYIDFLNVKSFSGNKLGSMTLARPERWKGPYLADNPSIQERFYVVVKTKKGYFIAPSEGVRLSNGKLIGKDIVYTLDTDFEGLMSEGHDLWHAGRPLAAFIKPLTQPSIFDQPVADRLLEVPAD